MHRRVLLIVFALLLLSGCYSDREADFKERAQTLKQKLDHVVVMDVKIKRQTIEDAVDSYEVKGVIKNDGQEAITPDDYTSLKVEFLDAKGRVIYDTLALAEQELFLDLPPGRNAVFTASVDDAEVLAGWETFRIAIDGPGVTVYSPVMKRD